jgi:trans-aconitate 2-methyltransferase
MALRHGRAGRTVVGMTPREWNASSYDKVAAPMTERGTELVDGLELRGDERVLDAGCGTGRVTERLLERLPDGEVVALDGSQAMLDVARERLGDDRVTYVHADLGGPLDLEPFDVVVSTSTFHWVLDHDALFQGLFDVLKPGGVLRAECGGEGNIANVVRALEAVGVHESGKHFAGVEETVSRLERLGFEDAWADLTPRPAQLTGDGLEEYLVTVVLGEHVERLGPEAGRALVRDVVARLDEPVIEYVRLNLGARRPR